MSFFWQEFLYKPLFNILIFLYNTIAFKDIGIAIIEITVIIRLILLPPSIKSLKAQISLQKIQPALDKIRAKYKDNKQKQTQAIMDFYQKNKINPFASCLPTLIQFPILIALFWIFRDALSSNNMHLLYPFVSNPGKVNSLFLGFVDLSQKGNFILAILAAVTQFVQSKMITPKPLKSQENSTQSILGTQMIYFLPLLTFVFALQFPAGLALYWAVTTVCIIITQFFVLKKVKEEKIDNLKIQNKNSQEKKSGFLIHILEKYKRDLENYQKNKR